MSNHNTSDVLAGDSPEAASVLLQDMETAVTDIDQDFTNHGVRAKLTDLLSRVMQGIQLAATSSRPPQSEVPDLEDFAAELRAAQAREDRAALQRVCTSIADWAEAQHATRTAYRFVQAAVSIAPDDPMLNYRAGKLARRLAANEHAGSWYRRAVALGTRTQEWEAVGLALSGLGNLEYQLGNSARAAEYHVQSLRIARAHGLRGVEADALHNLTVLALARGDADAGVFYASKAVDAYHGRRDRLVILANDLAWFWMDREGEFERALPIFRQLYQYFSAPRDRLYVLANIARAAGGAGDEGSYVWAWGRIWEMISDTESNQGHAPALVDLARGALSLSRFQDAIEAAGRALDIARERNEPQTIKEAESILDAAKRYAPLERVAPRRPMPGSQDSSQRADELATRVLFALQVSR